MTPIPTTVVKRDGTEQPFNPRKIEKAMKKTAAAIGLKINPDTLDQLVDKVELSISKKNSKKIARDDIDKAVVKTFRTEAFFQHADEYESFNNRRKKAKEIMVEAAGVTQNSTDINLLIENKGETNAEPFNPTRIADHLKTLDLGLTDDQVHVIVDKTENRVWQLYNHRKENGEAFLLDTSTIRALVATSLVDMGANPEQVLKAGTYDLPKEDLEQLIRAKTLENANVGTNNPEAVGLAIWETILKKYALSEVFSKEVKSAHLKGEMHLHDLGYITRVYCSGHSPAYLKLFGLKLDNLDTSSSPANHAITLSGHISTFLASMQAYYAGALGLSYMNLEFSPFLKGMSKKDVSSVREAVLDKIGDNDQLKTDFKQMMHNYTDMKQVAQNLIFTQSQSAFSRGGQTLFIDFNLHTGVPEILSDIPLIMPGGLYHTIDKKGNEEKLERIVDEKSKNGLIFKDSKGNVLVDRKGNFNRELLNDQGRRFITYKDYETEAQDFFDALLDVYIEGDENGKMFAFPKCDVHVDGNSFKNKRQSELLKKTCELGAKNSSAYFIFDRDAVTLAACCRLKTAVDPKVLEHPESLRFCGFQNVTVNLPQAAYRAIENGEKNLDGLIGEVTKTMDKAYKAHMQKREFSQSLMQPGRPLWQIGKKALDGEPYVDLDKATYIIGMLGLNEAIQIITGQEIHESEYAVQTGLKLMASMYQRKNLYVEQTGLKFSLEESPAESAARNLAKRDLMHDKYGPLAKEVIQGTEQDPYYSNSIHPRADAPISGVDRIKKQSYFHPVIESGAIVHLFTGSADINPDALYDLVQSVYENTQCAQLTVSGEHTFCNSCGTHTRGLHEVCPDCSSDKVKRTEKVVGYNSTVDNWNPSKREEALARGRGNYSIDATVANTETIELDPNEPTVRAVVYGKQGCEWCDNLKRDIHRSLKQTGYDGEIVVDFVDLTAAGKQGQENIARAVRNGMNFGSIPGMGVEFNTQNKEVFHTIDDVPTLLTEGYVRRDRKTFELESKHKIISGKRIKDTLGAALESAKPYVTSDTTTATGAN